MLLFVAMATAVVSLAQILPARESTVETKATKLPKTVPAAVENLRIVLDGISNSADIYFDMPSTNYGGEAQSEYDHCNYNIEVNGEMLVENQSTWWCEKDVSRTITADGHGSEFTITVWATNDDGDGPKTTISAYVGEDEVAPLTNVNVVEADGSFVLTWDEPKSAHGGNYDTPYVKYSVYKYPGNTLVGTYDYDVSSVTIPIEGELASGNYFFRVVQSYYSIDPYQQSERTFYSNTIAVKPYSVPFVYNITSADASSMTVFDVNGDDATWKFDTDRAVYTYDGANDADDWFTSVPISLNTKHSYRVTISVALYSDQYPERIEVKAGKGATPDDMTIDVISPTDVTTTDFVTYSGVFKVDEDGYYSLGFHAISDKNMYYLYLNQFSVAVEETYSGVKAPEGTIAAYYDEGKSQVKAAMTLPTEMSDGTALTSIDQLVITRDANIVYSVDNPTPGSELVYIDTPETYGELSYVAYAVVDGEPGFTLKSDVLLSKDFLLPDCTADLTNNTAMENNIVFYDVNEDGNVWAATSSGLNITYNSSLAMDDWVFLKLPIVFKGGKTYDIAITSSSSVDYPESYDIYLADYYDIDANRALIGQAVEVGGTVVTTAAFESHVDQIKYLAIHGVSPADRNFLNLTTLSITATGTCDVPVGDKNIAITSLDADDTATAATEAKVTVNLLNNGLQTIDKYVVKLFVDGEQVDSAEGSAIDSFGKAAVELTYNTPITKVGDSIEVYATVEADDDLLADDNTSATKTVTLVRPNYPAATGLNAVVDGTTVGLTWTEPDMSDTGFVTTVESFEDYPTFSTGQEGSEVDGDNIGNWTTVDVDGLNNYLYSWTGDNTTKPNFNSDNCKFAWIVIDVDEAAATDIKSDAATGNKCLLAGCAYQNINGSTHTGNDDWLISPELSGNAQTISLKAASVGSYTETFEVLYSTKGKNTDDFTLIATESTNSTDYKDYSYDLPAGAKYFAVRCTSDNAYGLRLDDITYEGHRDFGNIELKQYNVYRDSELIGSSSTTSYDDTNVADGTYSYQVTALYNLGESALTDAVEAIVMVSSGVSSITNGGITVSVADYRITVAGAAGQAIEIYSIDGRRVAATVGTDVNTFDVAAGVYIVRAGNTTVKVIAQL